MGLKAIVVYKLKLMRYFIANGHDCRSVHYPSKLLLNIHNIKTHLVVRLGASLIAAAVLL